MIVTNIAGVHDEIFKFYVFREPNFATAKEIEEREFI